MSDPDFREEGKKLASNVENWFDVGSKEYALKIKKFEEMEGRKVYITSNWVPKGDKWQYQSLVLFIPRGSTLRTSCVGRVCVRFRLPIK